MTVNIPAQILKPLLESFNLEQHGDAFEREYFNLLHENFPNFEQFWRFFVVPLTMRVENYPNVNPDNIYFRNGIDERLEEAASAHYSIFMNFVFVATHLKEKDSQIKLRQMIAIESAYFHLSTICDLTEKVLELWYTSMLECRGAPFLPYPKLTEGDFLKLCKQWYHKTYEKWYELNHAKGKAGRINPFAAKYILDGYFSNSKLWKAYRTVSDQIRAYRNFIAHDIKIARVNFLGGKLLMPKHGQIKKYKTWKSAGLAVRTPKILQSEFTDPFDQIQKDTKSLQQCLNLLWSKVLADYQDLLFDKENQKLCAMIGLNTQKTEPQGSVPWALANSTEYPVLRWVTSAGTSATPEPGSVDFIPGSGIYDPSLDDTAD